MSKDNVDVTSGACIESEVDLSSNRESEGDSGSDLTGSQDAIKLEIEAEGLGNHVNEPASDGVREQCSADNVEGLMGSAGVPEDDSGDSMDAERVSERSECVERLGSLASACGKLNSCTHKGS